MCGSQLAQTLQLDVGGRSDSEPNWRHGHERRRTTSALEQGTLSQYRAWSHFGYLLPVHLDGDDAVKDKEELAARVSLPS